MEPGRLAVSRAARGRSRRGRGLSTGIVRRIDELGRTVIPIEIRKRLGLTEKDTLEISVQNQTVVLSRPVESCVCGRTSALRNHRGRAVCDPCRAELATPQERGRAQHKRHRAC
jgi:transcriptional pleiotropic regulator of transition state genes